MRKTTTLLALVMALGLVAACSNGSSNAASGNTGTTNGATETASPTGGETGGGKITIDGEQANDHGSKDVSGQDELEVELDDFYFNPTVLQGTPGEQIKLELTNESGTLHNFSIDDQSINQDVPGGEVQTVTVTIPQSGQVVFYCKYHRTLGMLGALEPTG